jgi:hypothetical protein
MPRVQAGILIAAPGPIPSPSIVMLTGIGAPSVQKPDATQDNVANCQLGSLFIDYVGAAIYIKTAQPSGAPGSATANGTWSQLT